MKLFRCCDGIRDELIIEASSRKAAAERYIEAESWGDRSATVRVDIHVAPIDKDSAARWIAIFLEPIEPRCKDAEPHVWRELQMIVHDKGVYAREACLRCGVYRVTETGTGIQKSDKRLLKSIAYEEANAESLANLDRTLNGKQADLFDRPQHSPEENGEVCAPHRPPGT